MSIAPENRPSATLSRIRALIAGETDEIAIMATIACELHHADPRFDWTGFYRVTEPGMLKIGPYQGSHGCLTIPFTRGVCGRWAREGKTRIVNDVHAVPDHIACSSTTRSEIVVPVFDQNGDVRAVLDIDSDQPAAFTAADAGFLETVCALLAATAFQA
jgi:L-methionine (R)-S-oxide reductase